ncbi:MAG TPA: hypothetical protein PK466_14475 [Thermotogota bacterium]|mgnify:CR=1 FL=1|nr:hypothetical protein [Thermotogota bacterium]HPJ89771.1 hypothetical protein [Thermotogota bacterium]HPR97533.1 hypothetical protein [Thermotogota bacterium]
MKKYILFFLVASLLVASAFADYIYLTDGTKLSGKIVNFNENSADILLENGQFTNVNKSMIVRVDPVDSPTADEIMTGVSTQPDATIIGGADGPTTLSVANYPSGAIMDISVPTSELATMYADPDIELRKRMLMYSDMKKEPWIAAELSLIIPSAGHLYTGEWERGFLFLGARVAFGGVGLYGFSMASANQKLIDEGENPDNDADYKAAISTGQMLGGVGAAGFGLFTLLEFVDSYYAAERYNQVLRLRLGIEQFDPMMLPTFGK